MIASNKAVHRSLVAAWQEQFLELLPKIERQAHFQFRHLRGQNQEDAVREIVANAFCAFGRLVELNRPNEAYASALVRFAVAQYRAGRRVGCRLNSRDVHSSRTHQRHGFHLESFSDNDAASARLAESLADNSSTPVPDQAAFRIDFPAWLNRLSRRNHKLALFLALGNTPTEAARRFRISRGRISQIRSNLRDDWVAYHGGRSLQLATTDGPALFESAAGA